MVITFPSPAYMFIRARVRGERSSRDHAALSQAAKPTQLLRLEATWGRGGGEAVRGGAGIVAVYSYGCFIPALSLWIKSKCKYCSVPFKMKL